MRGVNKVILVGRLGNDPELRYTTGGSAVVNFSVATTEYYKDKATGENKEHAEWHKCCAFGKLAEVIGNNLKKGSPGYFEGSNRTRKWTDNNSIDRYTTEVIVNEFQFLDSKKD